VLSVLSVPVQIGDDRDRERRWICESRTETHVRSIVEPNTASNYRIVAYRTPTRLFGEMIIL
jgi:hypothetical protein